jgi:DNA-binding NarL/FixJ family response regulator
MIKHQSLSREAIIALSPVQSTVQITKELNMAGFNKIERVDYQEALIQHLNFNKPNIIVISSELPGERSTADLLNMIAMNSPNTRVIFISRSIEEASMFDIYFAKNISAWLLSERAERTMSLAIEAAEACQLFIDFVLSQAIKTTLSTNRSVLTSNESNYANLELLTEREAEVLKYLCEGFNYKAVAKTLFISESTVKTHINNVFTKLQVNDRTQAVLYALKHDLESLIKATISI